MTFTAWLLAPVVTGAPTPTGSVDFFNGSAHLGSSAISLVDGNYQASWSGSPPEGDSAITAIYSGDSAYVGSAATMHQVVGQSSQADSLVMVSTSVSPSSPGQAVTITATVYGSSITPTGLVTFLDGTTVLGSAALSGSNGQAQATWTTSSLTLGTHDIVALYSGDSGYVGSSACLAQTVALPEPSTSLSTNATPSPAGDAVTFTATVASALGSANPTGSVVFFDGSTRLGSSVLTEVNGQMQATLTTAALGLGSHTILAIYSGDSNDAGSGASLAQTIA